MTSSPWYQRLTLTNLLFVLLCLAGLIVFLFPFWAPDTPAAAENRTALLVFSGSVVLILLALFSEAQSGLTAQTIAMIGTLVGLNTILRVIETVVPLPGGFSPVFLLIILAGYGYGARLGLLMGALTMLVSGPLTAGGLGPWTPYQMLAAGWVGMGAAWLPRKKLALERAARPERDFAHAARLSIGGLESEHDPTPPLNVDARDEFLAEAPLRLRGVAQRPLRHLH